MTKFHGIVTYGKRMSLYKMFPKGTINGKKISRMPAKMIHAIYDKLYESGADMNSIYIPKSKRKNPLQYSLFDKDYDPLK